MPSLHSMNRMHMGGITAIGLLLIGLAVLVARCPWPACRYLSLSTYTISIVDEYRQFLTNATEFKAFHHVAAVKLDCPALRDDVVGGLLSGRLRLRPSQPSRAQGEIAEPDIFRAWLEGRILHIGNNGFENRRKLEIWAENVQQMITSQDEAELFFLSRLFGGVIIHINNKQKPMVLFSDEPCP